MSAICSNTLFQFTPEYKTLIAILNSMGFWPRYCREFGWGKLKHFDFAVPIACFTDIPLSLIADHQKFYGEFGIGMSDTWVKNNKRISPVWYINDLSKEILNTLRQACLEAKSKNARIANARTLSLIKPLQGKTKDKTGKVCQRNFYQEREWRYVPEVPINDSFIMLEESDSFDSNVKSERTKNFMAKFSISDIRYLIIKDESFRMKLIEDIDKIFANEEEVVRAILKSRILSSEQIKKDC